MMDDYFEVGIEDLIERIDIYDTKENFEQFDYQDAYHRLKNAIKNRRSNWGTLSEVAWALWLQKPVILIAGNQKQKEMLEKHPFMKESSIIVESVDELLEKKWINILYKSISSAIY
jgi:hypothetical protein